MPRWTEEARAAQAERMRAQRLWESDNGPKTEAGKKRSSMNAMKHGMNSALVKRFKELLREHKRFTDTFK